MSHQDGELMTMREVELFLGVSRTTVHQMMAEGLLHPVPYSDVLLRPKKHHFVRVEVEEAQAKRREMARRRKKAS